MSLANDSITTLTEYVRIPVNVEGVEAMVKAWLVNVEVYDLLLGVSWLRRVHCNQHYGAGQITISGLNRVIKEVPAEIVPMSTGLPILELDDVDDWTADEVCQQILDDQKN